MANPIPRVDISQELDDWSNAVYGEEVRSANVSALTKLQTQMNDASDAIEDELDEIEAAVNVANDAASTANAAAANAQTAIATANGAITTAQGYAQAAGVSATQAETSAQSADAFAQDASNFRDDALAARDAAQVARDAAQAVAGYKPDEKTLTDNEGIWSVVTGNQFDTTDTETPASVALVSAVNTNLVIGQTNDGVTINNISGMTTPYKTKNSYNGCFANIYIHLYADAGFTLPPSSNQIATLEHISCETNQYCTCVILKKDGSVGVADARISNHSVFVEYSSKTQSGISEVIIIGTVICK